MSYCSKYFHNHNLSHQTEACVHLVKLLCFFLHVIISYKSFASLAIIIQTSVLPVVECHEVPPDDLASDVGVIW